MSASLRLNVGTVWCTHVAFSCLSASPRCSSGAGVQVLGEVFQLSYAYQFCTPGDTDVVFWKGMHSKH